MTLGDANDPVLRALANLPAAASDVAREARVRARCRAALEQVRLRRERPARRSTVAHAIEAALVGGLCLLYLSTVIREALQLHVLR